MAVRWSGSPLEGIIYLLCVATSLLCAYLLLRAYRRSRMRLLIWSSICFWLLALNNLLLAVDILLLPENDLSLIRTFTGLLAVSVLLIGFIWEA
jgi:uncharacterized membrane protein